MPVRSLDSSVIRWPDENEVVGKLREWAQDIASSRHEVARVGYQGSYARGDWGVGSDLDVVVVVKASRKAFVDRGATYDTNSLPVPVDLVVYTEDELRNMSSGGLEKSREILWVLER